MAAVQYLAIEVKIRDEQQVDENGIKMPFINNDMWRGTINLENNRIIGWPEGVEFNVYDKVSDMGTYTLLDENQNVIACIENDYVPICCLPGDSGDYLDLEVSAEGVVTNMTKILDFTEFQDEEDC